MVTNTDPVSNEVEGGDQHLELPSGFRAHAVALGNPYSCVHTVEREVSLSPGEMELTAQWPRKESHLPYKDGEVGAIR